MLRPREFHREAIRKITDYERATFTATVTAVYSDAVYDVEVSASGARFYDVNNGTPYAFSVGDVVIVARLGGGRGNRHVIVAPAGRGNLAPLAPGGGGGGSSGQTETLAEIVAARSSDIYGAKPDLDARIDCVDAEVAAARHGAANLSAFLDNPTVESIKIHDAAKVIASDDGNLTFTDGITGTKTLADLAEVGAGNHDILSPTHPDTTPASLSAGDLLAAGADAKLTRLAAGAAGHVVRVVNGAPKYTPSLESICEQMLDLVLTNQLDTKSATKSGVTYKYTNEADANSGTAKFSGTGWASTSVHYYTSTAGDYFEFAFVGDSIVLWMSTAHLPYLNGTHACSVLLDGAAQSDWNQFSDASYSLGSLSYGVHVVRLTQKSGEFGVGEAVPNQLGYQGLAVSGDAVVLEHISPWLYVTSIGTGPTDNGGIYPANRFGEAILPRLPLSTNYGNDRVPTRPALDIDQGGATPGFVRTPILVPRTVSGVSGGAADAVDSYPRCGMTVALGSGGATRGCRPAANYWIAFGRDLVTAQIHQTFYPAVGRVTAPGAGSALAVGDLVFVVICSGLTTSVVGNRCICLNDANTAADLFKIPSALL
jgi:hypothetical protein